MSPWAKCAPKTVFLIAVNAGRTGVMIALPVVNYKDRQRPSVSGMSSKNILRLSALHPFILSFCPAVPNRTRIKEPCARRDSDLPKFGPSTLSSRRLGLSLLQDRGGEGWSVAIFSRVTESPPTLDPVDGGQPSATQVITLLIRELATS